jgi:hypothetical protein
VATVTKHCDKCGRVLAEPMPQPAYCAKCELINSLLVERYSIHQRQDKE